MSETDYNDIAKNDQVRLRFSPSLKSPYNYKHMFILFTHQQMHFLLNMEKFKFT